MEVYFENLKKIDDLLERLDRLEQKIFGDKRWLNVSETAYYLGYSKDHIHKLKADHLIEGKHYHKTTGRVLFDKVALDHWVQSNPSSKIDAKEVANNILKDLI